jgi:formylglycine-generating enzyme required for sulfatase activity
MDAADPVWPLFRHSPDPRVRSYIVNWFNQLDGDPATIVTRYRHESDITIRRALLLCLGDFDASQVPASEWGPLAEGVLEAYRDDPDPGLHAAAEWLLRRWGYAVPLAQIDEELQQTGGPVLSNGDVRGWYINGQAQTFVVLEAGEFLMGSLESEAGRDEHEPLHRRFIGRRFAISTREVTRSQWWEYTRDAGGWPGDEAPPAADDRQALPEPMAGMTWYEAARYCNWLSDGEGLPEDEWCYQPNDAGLYGAGMKAKDNFLELTGYRLPTEAEWEFACRAGTRSSRYYGQTETLLPDYAWYAASSSNHPWPVASLKPNDFGLFDMLGSMREWCHDRPRSYPSDPQELAVDAPSTDPVSETERRELRGGGYDNSAGLVRSAYRSNALTANQDGHYGFRPARTLRVLP